MTDAAATFAHSPEALPILAGWQSRTPALLNRLTPAQRRILEPVRPRPPGSRSGIERQ